MSTISSDRLREIVDGFTGLEVCALSDRLGPEETLAIATELLSLRESHPIEDGEGWAIYLPSADQTITVTRDEVTTELEAILSGGWDLRTEAALRVAIQAIYHSNPGTSKVENTPST